MSSHKSLRTSDSLIVVCISDTHRLHDSVMVPEGDLLIHAGDILHQGESIATLIDFNQWLGHTPHALRVVVPGNHDDPLEADPATRKLLTNAVLLVNRGIAFRGLRIWGSPVTALSGGAFGMWYPPDRRRVFSRIPANTDILVTHEGPHGILDCAPGGGYHAGDPELSLAVQRIRPKLHVFGHHHPGCYGVDSTDETVYVNASLLGEGGGIEREPIVLRIPRH